MKQADKTVPARWPEYLVLWIFRLLQRIDNVRIAYPRAFNAVLVGLSFVFALLVGPFTGLDHLTHRDSRTYTEALLILTHDVLASGIAFVVLRLTLPFLGIAQRALAVHEMGLKWATIRKGDFLDLLKEYSKEHPLAEDVRIICISGHTLFGPGTNIGDANPLKSWADHGRLDVLLPRSISRNPTVSARWQSYSEETKKRYPSVESLIEEINKSKEFLRQHGNKITEHDIVIVWRVVIFQRYCLVQRYLPNPDGDVSDNAPTFVYESTGKYSFYETYLEMFKAIRGMSQEIVAD